MKTSLFFSFAFLLILPGCMFLFQGDIEVGEVPQEVEDEYAPQPENVFVETWQKGLEVPWSLVFLDEEKALVSERKGNIRLIREGELLEEPYASLDVRHRGEGGLMGLAVHPGFPEEPFVYAMYTYSSGIGAQNRVVRLEHQGDTALKKDTILDDISGGRFHNGGRIAFGPDDMLYITTGETFDPDIAQDMDDLGGKILRISPEGAIPEDNPFEDSPVWAYGLRNSQGIAWHPETGEMFSSDHGPSGEFRLQGKDMINHIRKGKNYGWPRAIGQMNRAEYEDPLIMWEPATPPGGIAFLGDDLFVATLRSEALIKIGLDMKEPEEPEVASIERWFAEDESTGVYGRLRDVNQGPDEALYFLTSNRDGRGDPDEGDDRILKIEEFPE